MIAGSAQAQQPNVAGRRFSPDQVREVSPALERYTQERLYGEIWKQAWPEQARSQPRYDGRDDCSRTGARAHLLRGPGARKRRHAGRDLRDDHPPQKGDEIAAEPDR